MDEVRMASFSDGVVGTRFPVELVLPTPASPDLDLATSISCDWHGGDAW